MRAASDSLRYRMFSPEQYVDPLNRELLLLKSFEKEELGLLVRLARTLSHMSVDVCGQ